MVFTHEIDLAIGRPELKLFLFSAFEDAIAS
jgi:hypothetical protein